MSAEPEVYSLKNPVKIVTATSLFDGHDASINIMRRILQDSGAEVIHIGHNRSAQDVVDAAIEEDAQGIAVSSYQGGHVEYFKYMVDMLKEKGADHIKVFGGGGGVIIPLEIDELHAYGVARIYSPEDGAQMGLQGIINHMLETMDAPSVDFDTLDYEALNRGNKRVTANFISAVQEAGAKGKEALEPILAKIREKYSGLNPPVLGLTGTGGAGKSSLMDELINRFFTGFSRYSHRCHLLRSLPAKNRRGSSWGPDSHEFH